MTFLKQAIFIAHKDILIEVRASRTILLVFAFTILASAVFSFAFQGVSEKSAEELMPGFLWVTFAFAGVLACNGSFTMETDNACLEGLTGCPAEAAAIYMGKVLSNMFLMMTVQLLALPLFGIFFGVSILSPQLLSIVFLTTVGFAAVGTLFSGVAIHTQAREMVMAVLFFSLIIPLLISAVAASTQAVVGTSWSSLIKWIEIIAVFDVVFMTASAMIFDIIFER